MPTTSQALLNVRPSFQIDGRARENLGEAVMALDLRLPRSGVASLEVRLLNWGLTGGATPDFVFEDLRHGQRISVRLGEGATQDAFTGQITAVEERYGEGAPQLVVLAEDALHVLGRRRASRAFEDMALDQVVRQIAAGAGLESDVQSLGVSGTWVQNNESDLAFLLRQAETLDIALRMQEGKLRAREEEPDPQPIRLASGANATKIRVIADLNRQPVSVRHAGHDFHAGDDASGSSDSLAPAPAGRTAASILNELGWRDEAMHPHPFAPNQAQAEHLAKAGFRRRARGFLHGAIECRDTPDMRSGREVELSEVSPRLRGRYAVVDCHHRFDTESGLCTHIRVQKPDLSA